MESTQPKKRRVISPDVPESKEPQTWSNCFVAGNQVILAGMVARAPDGSLIGGNDPYAQSMAAFNNMKALVTAAGAKMDDIVKINVYLTDMRFRPAFLEARRKFFTGDFPAAVVVGNVTLASPDLLVEIDAWAFIGAG
jgi:enamine deaminase RidA (YjgF/YER057c/UK114 family)